MKEINKPAQKKYWIAHNDKDFIVIGETETGFVTTSGQAELEDFNTTQARDARVNLLLNSMIGNIQGNEQKAAAIDKIRKFNKEIPGLNNL